MPESSPAELTEDVLARFPLPDIDSGAAKDGRGHLLIVGGSDETAGAVLLAALAAFRVGVGRVRVATTPGATAPLMAALPEGRVIALPPGEAGAERVAELSSYADAVLVGTGAFDTDAMAPLLRAASGVVVADAAAIPAAEPGVAVVMPNEKELEPLGGDAAEAAARLGAVVTERGAETFVAAPDGRTFVHRRGNVGLATSGSGDVAAGVIAGLAARGADPLTATLWGSWLHACAGERAAARVAPVGYLARELLDELPRLLPT